MLVLFVALLTAGLLNLCYYFGFFKFALNSFQEPGKDSTKPVSVIICAKNEAENLRKFVPSILNQNYHNFELILINDASSDDTLEVIEEFQELDPRVKIVNVQNNEAFWANKKYALTLGIKKAVNPYLLFTDADCEPQSPDWITQTTAHFKEPKTIILGYGGYFINKKSLLNKLIRFETLLTAIQYFSYAQWGMPYMGVGRNLAYTSTEFYRQNGFASHLHIRSGDDDLFVNEAATPENTAISVHPSSFTRSIPKNSFKKWFIQKRRHVSIAGNYKLQHRFMLGVFYVSQLLFWILFIAALFTEYRNFALIVLAVRLLVQGTVYYNAAKKLQETDVVWLFPFLELFLICAQFGIFISNLISKPAHWK
ncbi:glycosyl transferase family 2 [Salinimicrobium marinum]|uniref:Glycosyl transferase family 2 n=1 Tax=Salinimicrobium marinum TaxID=680283 RepID=A0A918W1Y2_9FLAO|nr:glycosyltransferase [Salinimicrobium marinum]GHA46492.1 glycosyl transferase family 2 [Salinimicrobium marinum]